MRHCLFSFPGRAFGPSSIGANLQELPNPVGSNSAMWDLRTSGRGGRRQVVPKRASFTQARLHCARFPGGFESRRALPLPLAQHRWSDSELPTPQRLTF